MKKNKIIFLKRIILGSIVAGMLTTSGVAFAGNDVEENINAPKVVQDSGNALQNLKLSSSKDENYKPEYKNKKVSWLSRYVAKTKKDEGYNPLDLKQDEYVMYKTSYGRNYIGPKKQKVSITDVKFVEYDKSEKISINGKDVNAKEENYERLTFNVNIDPRLADISTYNIKETIPYLLNKGLPIAQTSIQVLNSKTGRSLSGKYGESKGVKVTIYKPKKLYFDDKEHKKTYYETNATSTKIQIDYPVKMKKDLCIAISGLDHQYVHNKDRKKEITKFENGHVTFDESIIESERPYVNHLIKVSSLK